MATSHPIDPAPAGAGPPAPGAPVPSAPVPDPPVPGPPVLGPPPSDPPAFAAPEAPRPAGLVAFLDWLPWERLLIWSLFLLGVYVLRHFFFIIFMTFLIAYGMCSVVAAAMRVLSPHRARPWLQRLVVVVSFVLLLGVLFGVGSFLYHPLKAQFAELILWARTVNLDQVTRNVMTRTLGGWRFESEYRSGEGRERLDTAFARFQDELSSDEDSHRRFVEAAPQYEEKFRDLFSAREGDRLRRELEISGALDLELAEWLREHVLPGRFQELLPRRTEQWDPEREDLALYLARHPPGKERPSLQEYRNSPQYTQDRNEAIRAGVFEELLASAPAYLPDFTRYLGEADWQRLAADPGRHENEFRAFYDQANKAALPVVEQRLPYDFDRFLMLRAVVDDREAFLRELGGTAETERERSRRQWTEFRQREEQRLVEDLLEREEWAIIVSDLRGRAARTLPALTQWLTNVSLRLVELVIQLALSLLLGFFITFDLPRLRRGLVLVEQSRARDFYREIAPGLSSFGRLIGRAFQAQGVIAVVNTILTYAAITWLGVQNAVFLSSIVFLCSFIPVLGVVLSSVPIAAMAIIQPDGGLLLALYAVLAILVVHFIEASILNPKILGDMLHLHPVLVLGILAIGEYFFGVWGLLLGVPVAVYLIRYVILAGSHEPAAAAGKG